MNRIIRTALLPLLFGIAVPLAADTLSVVPLSNALQNPKLADTYSAHLAGESTEFAESVSTVQKLMLNQPADEAERVTLHERLYNLARYRDTRVGKLFFKALSSSPDIENLPEGATFAELTTSWPLSFESHIRLRVAFVAADGGWLISALEVTSNGLGAASISGMAPYFGSGAINAEFLDLEPIDYIVGRDPAERQMPESERPEFDFDAALSTLFETESGAFETTINQLIATVTMSVTPKARKNTLKQHLATDAEIKTLVKANDSEDSLNFWKKIIDQLQRATNAPRPGAVPTASGASVTIRFSFNREGELVEGETSALRLKTGKIAPRGGINIEGTENGEAGE